MMLPKPLKCLIRRSSGANKNIEANLLGFVPSLAQINIRSMVDGIVILNTFSKGKIMQISLDDIEIVDEENT